MNTFIGMYLYLLIGAIFGWSIDSKEMKEDIPYASISSAFSLQTIRVAVYVVCAFVWLPAVILAVFDSENDESL